VYLALSYFSVITAHLEHQHRMHKETPFADETWYLLNQIVKALPYEEDDMEFMYDLHANIGKKCVKLQEFIEGFSDAELPSWKSWQG